MTPRPERFAVIRNQDILVSAPIASRIESAVASEGVMHGLSLTPADISWPRDIVGDALAGKAAAANGAVDAANAAAARGAADFLALPHSTFSFHGEIFAAVFLEEGDADFADSVAVPVRTVALSFSSDIGRFALLAKAHAQWASVSRFCGACGGPLVDANGHREVEEPLDDHAHGARFCPRCKRLFFPRMSPAVIVLVRKENTILLGHNVRFPGKRHSLLAGFVEIGETVEEAARREIREEAGIEIKNLKYLKSQPWPFPDSLMLGFTAEWASGEAHPDGVELDHLGWYTADNLPEMPMKGSIARAIIDSFISGVLSNS